MRTRRIIEKRRRQWWCHIQMTKGKWRKIRKIEINRYYDRLRRRRRSLLIASSLSFVEIDVILAWERNSWTASKQARKKEQEKRKLDWRRRRTRSRFFLRSSRLRVDPLLYDCESTDQREQCNEETDKNLDGKKKRRRRRRKRQQFFQRNRLGWNAGLNYNDLDIITYILFSYFQSKK